MVAPAPAPAPPWQRQRTLFLLLLNLLLGGSASSGRRTASSRCSSSTAGADVQEELLDILALKSLLPRKHSRLDFFLHPRTNTSSSFRFCRRTLAKRDDQMGSTSTLAALKRLWSLSACYHGAIGG